MKITITTNCEICGDYIIAEANVAHGDLVEPVEMLDGEGCDTCRFRVQDEAKAKLLSSDKCGSK